MIEQAEAAVEKAQRSIEQASLSHNQEPVQLAADMLAEDESSLHSLKPIEE